MLILLSPSKTMDMEPVKASGSTCPLFMDQAEELIACLRTCSTAELMEFMKVSRKIAELTREQFATWKTPFSPENAKPAVMAFTGTVYDGLAAVSLRQEDLRYTQQHLRILSGLYGLLRPLDLIQPYRLEMGRALKTAKADNLYGFWKDLITDELNSSPSTLLINLASNEYFKAVGRTNLNKRVISPVFKDAVNGGFKIISVHAKRARGLMARYLIENRIEDEQGLLGFSAERYLYNPALTDDPGAPVFTRARP